MGKPHQPIIILGSIVVFIAQKKVDNPRFKFTSCLRPIWPGLNRSCSTMVSLVPCTCGFTQFNLRITLISSIHLTCQLAYTQPHLITPDIHSKEIVHSHYASLIYKVHTCYQSFYLDTLKPPFSHCHRRPCKGSKTFFRLSLAMFSWGPRLPFLQRNMRS